MNSRSTYPPEPDSPITVFCKLFSDRVSLHLCMLRKKELDLKGGFSCEGCPMDAAITRRLQLAAEVPGTACDQNG